MAGSRLEQMRRCFERRCLNQKQRRRIQSELARIQIGDISTLDLDSLNWVVLDSAEALEEARRLDKKHGFNTEITDEIRANNFGTQKFTDATRAAGYTQKLWLLAREWKMRNIHPRIKRIMREEIPQRK